MDEAISEEVLALVKNFQTTNPFKITKRMHINIFWLDLGNATLGYNTIINRVPSIVLNTRMDNDQAEAICLHELGHHILHKGINTSFFKRVSSQKYVNSYENEANTFMFRMLFYDKEPNLCERDQLLKKYGLPKWMDLYFTKI